MNHDKDMKREITLIVKPCKGPLCLVQDGISFDKNSINVKSECCLCRALTAVKPFPMLACIKSAASYCTLRCGPALPYQVVDNFHCLQRVFEFRTGLEKRRKIVQYKVDIGSIKDAYSRILRYTRLNLRMDFYSASRARRAAHAMQQIRL